MGEDERPRETQRGGRQDISDTTAPSVGPHTTIEREDPEERLARHEQSSVDAMGLDKRREVVGGNYGASVAKQASLYVGVLAILAVLAIGFVLLAGKADQSPDEFEDQAAWASETAKEIPPQPLE